VRNLTASKILGLLGLLALVVSSSALAGPQADTHSRLNLVWDSQVTINGAPADAGIRGDGRSKFGAAASPFNEYQGNYCGVIGYVYNKRNESGNMEFDSDTNYLSSMEGACGAERSLNLYFGDATTIGTTATVATPHMILDGLWGVAAGASVSKRLSVGMQGIAPACVITFSATFAGASNALITRLADVQVVNGSGQTVTARQWRVQSQGNHVAACVSASGTDTGARYYLPFSTLITEAPAPYATYP
jgi:hypothetical protein